MLQTYLQFGVKELGLGGAHAVSWCQHNLDLMFLVSSPITCMIVICESWLDTSTFVFLTLSVDIEFNCEQSNMIMNKHRYILLPYFYKDFLFFFLNDLHLCFYANLNKCL